MIKSVSPNMARIVPNGYVVPVFSKSYLTATVILGQAISISTGRSLTHTEVTTLSLDTKLANRWATKVLSIGLKN